MLRLVDHLLVCATENFCFERTLAFGRVHRTPSENWLPPSIELQLGLVDDSLQRPKPSDPLMALAHQPSFFPDVAVRVLQQVCRELGRHQ